MGDLRGRALLVVLGCLICQLGLGYSYVYGPLLTEITTDLGWTRAQFSGARAPLLTVIALASPVAGAAALRIGSRRILLLATALLAATFTLLSQMQSLAELYVANVLLGLMMVGFGDIVLGGVVAAWIERGRGLALGIVYTGSNLGGAILSWLVVRLADAGDWRSALLQLGVGGAVILLAAGALLVRDPSEAPPRTAPHDPSDGRGSRHAGGETDLDLRAAVRTRSFWVLALSLLVFFLYFVGMIEHLVAALTGAGLERKEAAGWFSFALGLGLVSKVAMGALSDRIGARSSFVLNQGLLAVSAVLLLWVPGPAFLWGFILTYGFAAAARDVVFPLVVVHCFGSRYLAEIYGALMLVLAPAGTLGALLPAVLHDRTGSYELAFSAYAALLFAVLASLALLRREGPRAS